MATSYDGVCVLYFIDLQDEQGVIKDTDGSHFDDVNAAKIEALSSLAMIVSDDVITLKGRLLHAYVRDAGGVVVYKATLALSGEEQHGATPGN